MFRFGQNKESVFKILPLKNLCPKITTHFFMQEVFFCASLSSGMSNACQLFGATAVFNQILLK